MANHELESAGGGENMTARVDVRARITAATVGVVAAISVAVSMLWFSVGFVLYEPVLQAPWRGMSDYQSHFQPALYLAWAIPAFLFALAFLAMITCIHGWADDDQRTWTLLAVAFAVPGATLMAALYYIQMTVVPNGLVNGTADSLRLWIYAPPYPFTFQVRSRAWVMASREPPSCSRHRHSVGIGLGYGFAGCCAPWDCRRW